LNVEIVLGIEEGRMVPVKY